jgi:hypothetical protein
VDDRVIQRVVERQRRQLASVGWVLVVFGAVTVTYLVVDTVAGIHAVPSSYLARVFIGNAVVLIAGVTALWRARKITPT